MTEDIYNPFSCCAMAHRFRKRHMWRSVERVHSLNQQLERDDPLRSL